METWFARLLKAHFFSKNAIMETKAKPLKKLNDGWAGYVSSIHYYPSSTRCATAYGLLFRNAPITSFSDKLSQFIEKLSTYILIKYFDLDNFCHITHRSRMKSFCSKSPKIEFNKMIFLWSLSSNMDLIWSKYDIHL